MRHDIIQAVRDAGVVGAGGAGFPTHIKINAQADTVIANGAECEPLLRAHQLLMAAESEKIVIGLKTVMVATGAQRGVIALKKKYGAAVAALETAIAKGANKKIELFFLPDFYPAGDEQVVVHEVTGRIVPEGGIPLEIGAVVANVETLLNIANALAGKTVLSKYITVTGAVTSPVTLEVPVGTTVQELIKLAGGAVISDFAIVDGGPMMGKLIDSKAVVTKTTGGLIVLPKDHPVILGKTVPWSAIANRAKAVCCNCRACTDACPRYLLGHSLEPHRIMQVLGAGLQDSTAVTRAFLCSECGACEVYGCTMGLSPRRVNAEYKRLLAKAGVKSPHHAASLEPRPEREYRRIPTKRLVSRLGLAPYDVPAPFSRQQYLPDTVCLPLSQHVGVPSRPVVKVGDFVKVGDLVAAIPEEAKVGANLHASITGEIVVVDGYIGIKANNEAGGSAR
ncbi:MAG: Respiratory-chain dehydrogenase domain 51 kDa subunit [Firmicutes bacterium]|nr:Respiratory-chain dehydrogenase domain 51 kDa subunit [Bacillota bacterium]